MKGILIIAHGSRAKDTDNILLTYSGRCKKEFARGYD